MKGDSVKSKKGVDLRAQAEQFAAQRAAVLSDPAKPARDRAESIRDGLRSWVATRLLITEAYKGQDWVALGYTSWELYCDGEFDMKSLRLTADERNDAILSFRSVGMTTREIGAATGTSKDTASRALKASRVSGETKSPLVEALRGEIEAAAERTETSAAGPAATTGGAFPPVGEPVDVGVAAASTGTQDPPAAEPIEPSHAGVPAVGDQEQERDEGEAAEASADLPAAGWTEEDRETAAESLAKLEAGVWKPAGSLRHLLDDCGGPDGTSSSLRPGTPRTLTDEVGHATCVPCLRAVIDSPAADPMAPPSPQQPGQDSPTGLEAVQPHEDRSETNSGWGTADVGHAWTTTGGSGADFATDHHAPAGVSGVGEAPGNPPSLVELEELEDGDAAVTPSSSDPVPPTGDELMAMFATLVLDLDPLDAEALGPLLHREEMQLLDQYVDYITQFVGKLGRARFDEMRTS